MVHCRECGKKIAESASSCPKCGAKQSVSASSKGSSKPSKTSAGLLALFLGGIGIHQFYIGNSKKGILYLLFFWTFVPAILAFIDAIRFFMMSDLEFKKYVASIKK